MNHNWREMVFGATLLVFVGNDYATAASARFQLPPTYEENLGQTNPDVAYFCRSRRFDVFLTRDEAVFSPRGETGGSTATPHGDRVLRMRFLGRADDVRIGGRSRRLGRSSYFPGRDPTKWVRGAPHFGEAAYSELWPGVDLVFHSRDGAVAYDFILEPGADPSSIRLALSGAEGVEIDTGGDLVVYTGGGETIRHTRPVVFQPRGKAASRRVTGRWILDPPSGTETGWVVGFEVGPYDGRQALVIDPRIVLSTYLGAPAGRDRFEAVAIDSARYVYVTGNTESSRFPADNPFDVTTTLGGGVVSKLSPDGRELIWSVYIGSSFTFGRAIALDEDGVVYVAGDSSRGWPIPTTPDALFPEAGEARDAFVMRIHPRGDEILYATYLHGPVPGDHDQEAFGLAIDSERNLLVAGYTNSRYVTESAFQEDYRGANDAFLTKIRADGRAITYSTYLGGSRRDRALDLAVDPAGNAYLAGLTDSEDFPLWPEEDPLRRFQAGGFVASFSAAGEPVYSTYLGGTGGFPRALAVDASGSAYVAGAAGGGFQEVNPIFTHPTLSGFLAKITPEGTDIAFATLLEDGGVTSNLTPTGVAVDASGRIYLTGHAPSFSADRFPIVEPVQRAPEFRGTQDAFVATLAGDLVDHVPVPGADDAGDVFLFSSWLGGGDPERTAGATSQGKDIAVTADGIIAVLGNTSSAEFPTGPADVLMPDFPGPARNAEPDAFVTVIDSGDGDDVPYLQYGVPRTITLTPAEPVAHCRLPSLPGETIEVCVIDTDSADANVLSVRLGRQATRSVFDLAADERGRASQSLLVPYTAAGVYWVRVEGTVFGGGSNQVEVCANLVDLAVTGLSPVRAGVDTRVVAALTGAGFLPGTRFSLVGDGGLIPQAAATLISRQRADVEFDLTGAPPGTYRVRAEREGVDAVLSELTLEIVEDPRPDFLTARLEGPTGIRGNLPVRMTLVFENAGDTPMAWPLLELTVASDPALDVQLRLESEDEFQSETLQVFGAASGAGLHPGESGRVPIVLKALRPPGGGGGVVLESFTVRVARLLPLPGDFVPWDRSEELIGSSDPSVAELLAALSAVLGPRWEEYGSNLADYARRYEQRGKDPSSVNGVFLFAARDALRQARGDERRRAAAGRLVSDFTGEPLPGAELGAVRGDVVVSKTVTDLEGSFCLDRLLPGESYRLVAGGYRLRDNEVTVPPAAGADATGLLVRAQPLPSVPEGAPGGETVDLGSVEIEPEEPLPVGAALTLPEGVTSASSELFVQVGTAVDPNEKQGPLGEPDPEGEEEECTNGFISGGEIYYTIYFENDPKTANAAAQMVVIEDQLSPAFDWTTFRPVSAVVGDRVLSLDDDDRSRGFSTSAVGRRVIQDVTAAWPDLRVECDYNAPTGSIVFTFRTMNLDFLTTPPPESLEGFLPPNTDPPKGQGHVSYVVRSVDDLEEGSELDNEATITFLPDGADRPLTTNLYCNRTAFSELPLRPGTEPLYPPDSEEREIPTELVVNWRPSPRPATYSVCLWEVGPDFEPAECPGPGNILASGLTGTQVRARVEPGATYRWQVTARDAAGETASGPAWKFRTVGAPPPPPAAPVLLSPADAATEVERTPTLRWQAAANASAYRVRVWPKDEGPPAFENAAVSSTSFTLPGSLVPSTTYLWQVTALNVSGEGRSQIREFTTEGVSFRRGDANGDQTVDITDGVLILDFLFGGEGAVACLDALDTNDTGDIDVSDGIFLLRYLFASGTAPPAPGPDHCGKDATPGDGLGCLEGC